MNKLIAAVCVAGLVLTAPLAGPDCVPVAL